MPQRTLTGQTICGIVVGERVEPAALGEISRRYCCTCVCGRPRVLSSRSLWMRHKEGSRGCRCVGPALKPRPSGAEIEAAKARLRAAIQTRVEELWRTADWGYSDLLAAVYKARNQVLVELAGEGWSLHGLAMVSGLTPQMSGALVRRAKTAAERTMVEARTS